MRIGRGRCRCRDLVASSDSQSESDMIDRDLSLLRLALLWRLVHLLFVGM